MTYLLSGYDVRNQLTALALAIARLVGRRDGEDPGSVLIAVRRAGAAESLGGWLGLMMFDMASLVELRGQYPLLHYSHEPNDDRAMPIALSDLLELVSLAQSMLDPGQYPALADGPTIKAVERVGRHYLGERDGGQGDDTERFKRQRRRRYTASRERLAREGIALRPDEARGLYQSIAGRWDVADYRMRGWVGYPQPRRLAPARPSDRRRVFPVRYCRDSPGSAQA